MLKFKPWEIALQVSLLLQFFTAAVDAETLVFSCEFNETVRSALVYELISSHTLRQAIFTLQLIFAYQRISSCYFIAITVTIEMTLTISLYSLQRCKFSHARVSTFHRQLHQSLMSILLVLAVFLHFYQIRSFRSSSLSHHCNSLSLSILHLRKIMDFANVACLRHFVNE